MSEFKSGLRTAQGGPVAEKTAILSLEAFTVESFWNRIAARIEVTGGVLVVAWSVAERVL